jgi:ribosomal protein S18 acetylase RimI-like enzyme
MIDDVGVMRDFLPRDQTNVRALVLAGMRERWGDVYDPRANPDLDDISTSYLCRGADVVVVEVGDKVVATGLLLPQPACRGRILRVSVDHNHRRRGHGRQVVDELTRRARRRGMVEVLVKTDTPWESARALYSSCGFQLAGQDETDTHFVLPL